MTEIARLTKVSQPTVSRVLNGNRNVDPAIRERVLACAREHDYQPNVLAKGLQGRRTMLLGVLMPDVSDSFFGGLTSQIEAEARKRGCSVILSNSGGSPENEREFLSVARRYRVDGLLAVPVRGTDGWWQEHAKRLDVPVVAVARRVPGLDCVYADQEQAGTMVAEYLAGRGYKRFLFAGGGCEEKYAGFRRVLESMGFGEHTASTACEGGEELCGALRDWFRSGWGRAAVFADSDDRALRVLDALRTLGLSVPGNVGVIGFGDAGMARCLNPRLTSVAQPVEQMAREAVERLLARVEAPDSGEHWEVPLSASLVVREST